MSPPIVPDIALITPLELTLNGYKPLEIVPTFNALVSVPVAPLISPVNVPSPTTVSFAPL